MMNKSMQRRQFLKRALYLGAGVSLVNSPLIFASEQDLNSQTIDKTGYKALVCIDLSGGNDSANMLVPYSLSAYESYKQLRTNVALEREQLLPINPAGMSEQSLALHPSLTGIQQLFTQEQVAFVANVGPMVTNAGAIGVTPKRGSHRNQQQYWQGLDPVQAATSKQGWQGLTADLYQGSHQMNSSISGKNVWQTGRYKSAYVMGENGPEDFINHDNDQLEALISELADDAMHHDNALVSEYSYNDQNARLLSSEMKQRLFSEAVNGQIDNLNMALPANKLGRRFEMVLRSLLANDTTTTSRQSFYIKHGGYDFHSDMLVRQAKKLTELNDAIVAFQAALAQFNLTDQVTSFTISDFGRSSTTNGTGTAHGWGGHQMIIGGAVAGGTVYGKMPNMAVGSDDLTQDKGIMIPTTAVDQYSATLAMWFGVPQSRLEEVLPNIDLFSNKNLGFMRT
ncbi:DUF1501 domain-containing protein [Psychrobium sp. 1_MG-2023]|uniref:DUF1501 domain-containing protein n=1 Tax=Psychrobium sp. 1_MG-2023 TaxID=3062624 RepID=UPI000C32801A|nr:DUF1501 domain-containing protein [Psychrobium sp. 1_MG-2023]MDP2559686.1 DUF1501 domain-containing protein [Psychrobium sp. 1_MG-2023]PKF59517.1 hypothetical protein CW748_01725 [Alteromonadales bacterium alter-6D02]